MIQCMNIFLNLCNVLVAGGDCDHKLGRSTATVNIMGCDWKADLEQESYKQEVAFF